MVNLKRNGSFGDNMNKEDFQEEEVCYFQKKKKKKKFGIEMRYIGKDILLSSLKSMTKWHSVGKYSHKIIRDSRLTQLKTEKRAEEGAWEFRIPPEELNENTD